MPNYALYIGDEFLRLMEAAEKPRAAPHKNALWYDVIVESGADAFVGLDPERGAHVIRSIDPATQPPTHEMINAERDRRAASGFLFNGVMFQSRVEDQKRINGAGTLAVAAIMAGAQPGDLRWHGGEEDFAWIASDNSLVTMDAHEVVAFGKAAARWEANHIFAARALKSMQTPPVDYTANSYWPD